MSSAAVQVQVVRSKKQQKQFVQFAWDHYCGDPNWVPPLRKNHRELLGYLPHPFYDNAKSQTFLAFRQGQVVGRIAAIVDYGHNARFDEKRGMFGFFECVEDQDVANQLFDVAVDWMREQGMTCARGPSNPSLNHGCALLVDGFDSPPVFMMSYNKPFYGQLIEGYGFAKSQDMYAYWGHMDMVDKPNAKLSFVVEESMRRFDMTVRRINTRKLKQEVESFMRIYNVASLAQWGFVPLTETEIQHVAAGLKHLIVPEMTTIIEIEEEPVAVVFGMLDYNPIIKKIDGKLFPFGFLRIIFGRKRLETVRMVGTYVVPKYQKWGLGLVLMFRVIPDARNWGIKEGEFSWVLESNKLSRGTLERAGAKLQKTYRMYDIEFK
jgi:GNAT superfamily N-acetyltransferase